MKAITRNLPIIIMIFLVFPLILQCVPRRNYEAAETVVMFFIAVDERHWDLVKKTFADKAVLDYTSMTGGQPAEMTPAQIVANWKTLLPGFDKTHHQIGNVISYYEDTNVLVFCYGTATHYLDNPTKNNIWTVAGTYEFYMKRENMEWKINKMKFNLRYIDGNKDLPNMAKERAKKYIPEN